MVVVHVTYYTDPACPWSWAAEPALRRIMVEFGDEVAITYVMGGLAREVTDPGHELLETLEASAASGMPVDPRVWNGRLGGRAPRSSYPACLAVKAAAEQRLDGPYLRVLREGFLVERRPLDTPDALEDAARRVAGMNLDRFDIDLRSNAMAEAFGADLDRVRGVPEERRRPQGDRAPLPSFEVRPAGGGDVGWVTGEVTPQALRDAVVAAGATPVPLPGVEEALGRFGRMAVPEVAAVCDLPHQRASAELWRLAMEWRARPERVLAGELWTRA